MKTEWDGKPYYSLDSYCKNTFGEKVYKIALDAGFTCPNRDGTLDNRGCIFCSGGGSGEFAAGSAGQAHNSIAEQLCYGKTLFQGRLTASGKLNPKKTGRLFIAYFQSYTNTYAPLTYLNKIYREALSQPYIAGISIATRPDCVSGEVCRLLEDIRRDFSDKFIWVELGLQTKHEKTAVFIRRGYRTNCFEGCIRLLHDSGIPSIVHVILGLPGENRLMQLETITYLNQMPIQGVKLQLLHILKGTDLYSLFLQGKCSVLTMDEYIHTLIACLELLSPGTVIHRLTGDGARNLLEAPLWSLDKRKVLNTLHQEMLRKETWQGKCFP